MPRNKEHGISRFNVNSNLRQNLKFIRLCKELKTIEPTIPEESILGILIAFWSFVANNRAMNGSIEGIDPWIVAKESLWTGKNRTPESLITALQNSELIDQNGQIHDWFDHQPLAKEILRSRKRRETADNTNDTNTK